ncbi:endonuclease/exonuclease/phosphatase family protein [Maritimibacter dapengensis]|uniref:Endonuclease/exonuclease/phosphatase domain-containing protein n=1 Tax=Maritimibacter dapengensis TaxID=2836868 RepID=A0ABS6SXH4_9RHOB|nr:endonuclease/exonuclease/phosphatase family protein [Maritimibacter dapengensis]MBV7377664.1 hypothetical protein [Maritimibacter dapengensis]
MGNGKFDDAARFAVRASAWGLLAVVALGFLGGVLAAGDTFAVVRPLAGTLLAPIAIGLFRQSARRLAILCLLGSFVSFGSLAPVFLASGTPCKNTCLTLYQKNLLSRAWPRYPLADDIIASGADIVTLQEVSDHNRKYMARMYDHYPTKVICPFRPRQDVGLLTSLPIIVGSAFCLEGAGLAGVQVITPDAKYVWALSLHLEWPFPYDQMSQALRIADKLETLDGPVVIGGDFNMVPWGRSARMIRKASGTRSLGPIQTSYEKGGPFLPLPIDQVLVPTGATGRMTARPEHGSDHEGRLASIALP